MHRGDHLCAFDGAEYYAAAEVTGLPRPDDAVLVLIGRSWHRG